MTLGEAARQRVAAAHAAWDRDVGAVLVAAGDPVPIAGSDQYFPFQAHPEFRYLTGLEIPSAVLAIDLETGEPRLFVPHPDIDDRVWHSSAAPQGAPIAELDKLISRHQPTSVARLGATVRPAAALRAVLDELRVRKDAAELAAMRAAAAATAAGFEALEAMAEPGLSEHQLRAVIDGAFCFNGGDRPAYDSIVASGPNAAVLHFTPGARRLTSGDFLLVDAGARVDGYACDVTRTWVAGAPSTRHDDLWHAVLAAQQQAVDRCRPGVEYRGIHLDTARNLATSFVEMGLLRGDPTDLVMRGAMAVFFPHGVGHLIGLGVHDPAGYAAGRERSDVGGTRFLRTDRILEADVVVTIEPGVYFIDALLDDPGVRRVHADDIVWSAVEAYRGIGGVRVEDTVHVTAGAPEVLSGVIPKRLEL